MITAVPAQMKINALASYQILLGDIGENESAEVSHAAKFSVTTAADCSKAGTGALISFEKCEAMPHVSHRLKYISVFMEKNNLNSAEYVLDKHSNLSGYFYALTIFFLYSLASMHSKI